MTTQKAVAKKMSELLEKNGQTPYSFCKNNAMSEETLRAILNERTVKLDTLILLADGFGMTIQEFLNDPLFERQNLDVE